MKYYFTLLALVIINLASGQTKQKEISQLINKVVPLAIQQYSTLEKATPDSNMPRSFDPKNNTLVLSDTKWWCSGFFPGSLWYIYELSNNSTIKQFAEKRTWQLEPIQYFTENHDLGFMIFCPFGNAYRLTKDSRYKPIIHRAANSLSTRYRPSIQSIQSWESSSRLSCPVIIDNMMNLELLYWSSINGGDDRSKEIAITHANTTIKNHFRDNYSSYHVIDYDLQKGTILKKVTWQGLSDSSSWSRGQSWGLYGFTMMFRFTKNQLYLSQAQKIANYLASHPNLPNDKIPFWDYNIKEEKLAFRDASAAAIMASALLELARFSNKNDRVKYLNLAETIILSLGKSEYLSTPGESGGFLLKHNVGSLPHKSEVDVSLTYADYYFLECLQRYKKWYL
jgi:unsaturated chondroitin disaccharide hydrolase